MSIYFIKTRSQKETAMILITLLYSFTEECENVVNLARGLGMESSNPTEFTSILNNCCSSKGITCSGAIVGIKWNGYNLEGKINGTALPPYLRVLHLEDNKIYGDIPTLPSTLTQFFLDNNNINGSLPDKLPIGLQYVSLTYNMMSGNFPTLPQSIQNLYLSPGNLFSGSLVFKYPVSFSIYGNWISDVVVYNSSRITSCDISNNPLLNNPHIANLTMCTKNDLYSFDTLSAARLDSFLTSEDAATYNLKTRTSKPLSTTDFYLESTDSYESDFYESTFIVDIKNSDKGEPIFELSSFVIYLAVGGVLLIIVMCLSIFILCKNAKTKSRFAVNDSIKKARSSFFRKSI
eukprot:NODE_23_length_38171_cov_0.318108.p12 type:complete len:348 gc:universal NODE_23_length_38171_cov_0.318108:7263-8306(+)